MQFKVEIDAILRSNCCKFMGLGWFDLRNFYDQNLYESREVLLNDGDDIRNGINLIEYLVESGSETYSTWQQDLELNQNNLSLDLFLARNFPKINEQLAEEILVVR